MKLFKDLNQIANGSVLRALLTILLNPNFHATCIYRLSHFLFSHKLSIVSKCLMYLNRVLYSVDIDYRAQLAGGLVLVHGAGVVIGKNVKSMGNLTIYQNVTLGGNRGKTSHHPEYGTFDQPIMEDNVVVYGNSMILGPVVIGKASKVGAGTIVLKDVPKNSVVYSDVDIKIIQKDEKK